MAGSYLGDVRAMSFDAVPAGWAPCKGQLLATASNTGLFSLLLTSYGGGGATSFGLPDVAPLESAGGSAVSVCIRLYGEAPTVG